MTRVHDWSFAGETWHLRPERALFWPRRRVLIVADLHLEKGSWFAALGQPLPPYDSHDTVARLETLATATGAREIWCLGDSLHDAGATTRIDAALADRIAELAQRYRLLWIAGNHDGLTAGQWGGDVADELYVDGICFRHESRSADSRPEVSGHFHPKLRLAGRGGRVERTFAKTSSPAPSSRSRSVSPSQFIARM